ncbi:dynamin family protein [Oceanobacillus salinisoli]|uniref:dynamin family protein n=1 Tax=Oceanobacillus salinisoli TaxID=2678611 RepID=UPI0012E2CBB0|nr:dynamin family protein [Oceanobacillus salinisoli]
MNWRGQIKQGIDSWMDIMNGQDKYQAIIERLSTIRKDIDDELTVLIAGEFKAGKSTFINALLGEKILTSDVTPATAVVTKLVYSKEKRILAHYKNGETEQYDEKWLEQLTAERTGEFQQIREKVNYIELQLPNHFLRQFTIVDSPGLNSDFQHHTEATEKFLERADVVIWLFNYRNIGTSTEFTHLQKLISYQIETIGVINGIDLMDEEEDDLEEIIDFNKRRLGSLVQKIMALSAKEALEGKVVGDSELLEYSNWHEVDKLFDSLSQLSNRKVERVYQRLIEPLEQYDKILLDEKSSLQLHRRLPLINQFSRKDFPLTEELYNEVNQAIGIKNQKELYWKDVFPNTVLNLYDSETVIGDIVSFIHRNGIAHDYALNQHWSDMRSMMAEYNQKERTLEKASNLKQQMSQLQRDWDELKGRKYFKKRKLQTFSAQLVDFNEKAAAVIRAGKEIKPLENKITKQITRLEGKIQECIDRDMDSIFKNNPHLIGRWNGRLQYIEEKYAEITTDSVEEMAVFFASLKQFQEDVSKSLTSEHSSIKELSSFKKVIHILSNIDSLYMDFPFDFAILQFQQMSHFEKIDERDFKIPLPDLIPANQMDRDPIYLSKLNYNPEREIRKIEFVRKKRLGYSTFTAIIAGLLIFYFDREKEAYKESEQMESYQAYEVEETINEEIVEDMNKEQDIEKEPEPIDQQLIYEFLRDLQMEVNTLYTPETFHYPDWMTVEAWDEFETYLYETMDAERGDGAVTYIEHLPDGSANVEAVVDYSDHYSEKEYHLRFQIKRQNQEDPYTEESLLITSFSYEIAEETEIEIPVSESSFRYFIENYRSSYMDALNYHDFSIVASYFQRDSAAYREIEQYIQDISGNDFYFDFETVELIDIQQIAPNQYVLTTNETFTFYDENDQQTYYERTKGYTVNLQYPENMSISQIDTIHTEKQTIEASIDETVVESEINAFINSYYEDLKYAFNGYGFSYLEPYYNPDGEEYTSMSDYIAYANEENTEMENRYLEVETIEPYENNYYTVAFLAEDDYFLEDGTGYNQLARHTLLIFVADDGDMQIETSQTDILEETEFTWEISY